MGLILDARGSFLLGSVVYGKRSRTSKISTYTLRLHSLEDPFRSWVCNLRSSVEGAGPEHIHMMNTTIESSTEVCPCKSGAPIEEQTCVMVTDECSWEILFVLSVFHSINAFELFPRWEARSPSSNSW